MIVLSNLAHPPATHISSTYLICQAAWASQGRRFLSQVRVAAAPAPSGPRPFHTSRGWWELRSILSDAVPRQYLARLLIRAFFDGFKAVTLSVTQPTREVITPFSRLAWAETRISCCWHIRDRFNDMVQCYFIPFMHDVQVLHQSVMSSPDISLFAAASSVAFTPVRFGQRRGAVGYVTLVVLPCVHSIWLVQVIAPLSASRIVSRTNYGV